MFAIRWQPAVAREFNRLQQEMNRLFGDFAGGAPWQAPAAAYPPVNLWEDADNVCAEAELPGVLRENVHITIAEGNQVIIEGERKPLELGQGVWHRQERGCGQFRRALTLPCAVDADKVEACLEHGVLLLKLPKAPQAKPRRITVKSE